jgi:predicted NBD/HSP70 family sugar kinase
LATTIISDTHLSIIKALYFNGVVSSLEISRITELSIPTVTKNVNELVSAGYVFEKGFAPSATGRKPLVYELAPNSAYVLSVAMDQFYTKIMVVDMLGNNVGEVKDFELDLSQEGTEQALLTIIEHSIKISGIEPASFIGMGISMPGFVNVEKGYNHIFLNTVPEGIRRFLADKTSIPVYIDNDSSVIALAEQKFGFGRQRDELMVINLGWGIGLGMIISGKIFRGFNGFAGEFSHLPIFANGKLCSCGKRGCLETEASLITIEQKAFDQIELGTVTSLKLESGRIAISEIFNAARQGDSLSIKLISEAAAHIGKGIATLIHIMNPQSIVLSGKGAAAGKIWLAPIQQVINEYCIPTLVRDTDVVLSELGAKAQLIGSAALVIDHLKKEHFLSGKKSKAISQEHQ